MTCRIDENYMCRFWENSFLRILKRLSFMGYSHWLSLGPGPGQGPGPGRVSCMVLRRTFHIEPEREQGRIGYVPIFQVLKLFHVVGFNNISMAFRCPVLAPDTASVNDFCIISFLVPIPVSVLDTASVNTPLVLE